MATISPTLSFEILIVDDDQVVQFLHSSIIKLCNPGYVVNTYNNGDQALKHIESKGRPLCYLVLLDLNMPVMNGFEFLEQCRKKSLQNVYIAVISSSPNFRDKFQILTFDKVIAYFEKPLTKQELHKILSSEKLKSGCDAFIGDVFEKKL